MSTYEIWKYLHVLMFVFWVGTDMGVMLGARKSTDSRLTLETRLILVKMALLIELLPRTMWAMALPFGVMLSRQLELLDISDAGVAGVWLFTLVWVSISLGGAHYSEKPIGQRLAAINRWIIGVARRDADGDRRRGPISGTGRSRPAGSPPRWRCTASSTSPSSASRPRSSRWARPSAGSSSEGSTPEVEAAISRGMQTTMFWVYTSYILILIVGFIGIARPEAIDAAFLAYFAFIAVAASAAFTGMGKMLRMA